MIAKADFLLVVLTHVLRNTPDRGERLETSTSRVMRTAVAEAVIDNPEHRRWTL